MPKGGARTRSGPSPDPHALRRERDEGEWKVLPATGRPGAPPPWPLGGKQTARERTLWSQLWALPQAVMWERQSQSLEVALYARRLSEAETPGSAVSLSTLVRQMADSLGLTTPGLRANRWRIDSPADEPASSGPAPRRQARERFKVVAGGGG